MVQETSIETYKNILETGALNRMQQEVFESFVNYPSSSDGEIAEYCQIKINIVTARRNELVEQGFIVDDGIRACEVSNRQVHVWKVRSIEEINKGKPEELKNLKDSDMQKIHKKIMKANEFQKQKIIEWCKK